MRLYCVVFSDFLYSSGRNSKCRELLLRQSRNLRISISDNFFTAYLTE